MESGFLEMEQRNPNLVGVFGLKEGVRICIFGQIIWLWIFIGEQCNHRISIRGSISLS